MSKPFCVSLKEYPGDKFTVKFFCRASSDDDAFDQAEDAYPHRPRLQGADKL